MAIGSINGSIKRIRRSVVKQFIILSLLLFLFKYLLRNRIHPLEFRFYLSPSENGAFVIFSQTFGTGNMFM